MSDMTSNYTLVMDLGDSALCSRADVWSCVAAVAARFQPLVSTMDVSISTTQMGCWLTWSVYSTTESQVNSVGTFAASAFQQEVYRGLTVAHEVSYVVNDGIM